MQVLSPVFKFCLQGCYVLLQNIDIDNTDNIVIF